MIEAIEHVIAVCEKAEMPIGWFGISADAVRGYLDRGCTLITAGVDTLLLSAAGGKMLRSLRDGDD